MFHCTSLHSRRSTHLLPCDFFVFGRLPADRDSSYAGRLDAYPCSASATKKTAIPSKSADYGTAKIDGSHVDVCVECTRLTISNKENPIHLSRAFRCIQQLGSGQQYSYLLYPGLAQVFTNVTRLYSIKTINKSIFIRSEVHDCVYRCQKHTRRVETRDSAQRFVICRRRSGCARAANRDAPVPTIKYLGQSRELCVSKQNIFFSMRSCSEVGY